MARGRSIDDAGVLQMALVGYQIEKERIENQIREIQSQLKGRRVTFGESGGEATAPRKRELSPAARARIAAAQRKRWAEHRKRKAQSAPKVKTAGS
jgi:hypothetical protein